VRKEALAALIVLVLACLVSAVADAPLEGPADPASITGQSVKAPWIFCGIQQMLHYISPVFAGFLLPLAALIMLALIPFSPKLGRLAVSVIFFSIVLISVLLTVWGYFR
jgi:hypothetical protein